MRNNIHILSTESSSKLSIDDNGTLILHRKQWRKNSQNIYITSDEEIKDEDWFLSLYTNTPQKIGNSNNLDGEYYKKIILTTDSLLIDEGMQAIDDEFLEWFVKNPTCEYVDLVKDVESNHWRFPFLPYKIITPKEEPKQEIQLTEGWNPNEQIMNFEPKQTLEEAAKTYYEENIDQSNIPREHYEWEIQDLMVGFASKFQEQKSYSEEDMFDSWKASHTGGLSNESLRVHFNKWFEQFKKK